MKLGEILRGDGAVTEADLARGVERAARDRLRLGSALVAEGIVDAACVARALARQHGVAAAIEDEIAGVDPGVIDLIPEALAWRHLAVPLALRMGAQGRELLVAVRDPNDLVALGELAFATGYPITPAAASEGWLRWAVGALHRVDPVDRRRARAESPSTAATLGVMLGRGRAATATAKVAVAVLEQAPPRRSLPALPMVLLAISLLAAAIVVTSRLLDDDARAAPLHDAGADADAGPAATDDDPAADDD